jgi:hypothetical protein
VSLKLVDAGDANAAEGILREQFYGRGARRREGGRYKVVCISLSRKDIERLDSLVAELRRRGHAGVSKSGLIRFALGSLDIDKVPREI